VKGRPDTWASLAPSNGKATRIRARASAKPDAACTGDDPAVRADERSDRRSRPRRRLWPAGSKCHRRPAMSARARPPTTRKDRADDGASLAQVLVGLAIGKARTGGVRSTCPAWLCVPKVQFLALPNALREVCRLPSAVHGSILWRTASPFRRGPR